MKKHPGEILSEIYETVAPAMAMAHIARLAYQAKKRSISSTSWKGVSVCRTAFLQILGIGKSRLARTKKAFRGEDARRFGILAQKEFDHPFYLIIITVLL